MRFPAISIERYIGFLLSTRRFQSGLSLAGRRNSHIEQ
jgi:hypothetical protein